MYVAVGFLEVVGRTQGILEDVRRHGESPCFLNHAVCGVKVSTRIVYISVYAFIVGIMGCMV